MSDEPQAPTYQSTSNGESNVRLRSVPYRSPFVWAGIFATINYCGIVAILTTLLLFFLNPTPLEVRVLVISVIFYAVSAVISFLKRRKVLCPLCKGTPLINSRAHVHTKAFRIFPLGYGTSATLALIFSQTFRCMYCGARFDILKPKHERKTLAVETRHDNLN